MAFCRDLGNITHIAVSYTHLDVYKRQPLDQKYVSLGITLPIMDWGRGRGQVRVARSNRDLVYTQVEQDKTDFDLNVRKLVKQFNLQAQRDVYKRQPSTLMLQVLEVI